MSLHAKIMNLQLGIGASEWKSETLLYPYKCGHRDARHAAAELAAQHDAVMERMAKALLALDECYCEASFEMTREQRANHRKVLIEARAALAAHAEVTK